MYLVQLYTVRSYVAQTHAANYSINIQHFVTCSSYMLLSRITLEFYWIVFSLRMGQFTKFYSANMSFATNSPNFPAAKVSLRTVSFYSYVFLLAT